MSNKALQLLLTHALVFGCFAGAGAALVPERTPAFFFAEGYPSVTNSGVALPNDEQHEVLDRMIQNANMKLRKFHVTLTALTSNDECDRDCQALAERRANLVRNWIIGRGIDPLRISIVSASNYSWPHVRNWRNVPANEFARRVEFTLHE